MNQSFLQECKLPLISDWAILNDVTPGKLHRTLSNHPSYSYRETQTACVLLEAYHSIYRVQLQQSRLQGCRGRCPTPTLNQLEQIAQYLQAQTQQQLSPQTVLHQLQTLACALRQRRSLLLLEIAEGSLEASGRRRIISSFGEVEQLPH